MVKDLVCGMEVNETSAYSLIFEDEKYFFCSQGCRAEFKRRPQEYMGSPSEGAACCGEPFCGKPEAKGEKRNV